MTDIQDNHSQDCADASVDTATGKAAPPEISEERVKGIFSGISEKYGLFNAVSSFGIYKVWLSRLVSSIASESDGKDVLDIAGGTGDVTFALCKKANPAHIKCTDLVPEMLDVARRRYKDGEGCGVDIDFQTVDAQDIPFADDSFDVITIAYGLRNIPDRPKALKEMLRVLKPGGKIACLEFSEPKNALLKGSYKIYLDHMIPFWGGVITGNKDGFVYLADSIKAFPNQHGAAKLFEDAGFEEVNWKDCFGGIAAIHTALKPVRS